MPNYESNPTRPKVLGFSGKKVQSLRDNIWKMYAIKLFKSMLLTTGVLIPFFTDWGNLSFTQIMLIQSWFLFWAFALEVPTGTIADVFGRKISMALGAVIGIVGVVVYVASANFYLFLLGEFLLAVKLALISGSDHALLYDTLKKTKSEKKSKSIFSRYQLFGLIGILIAAPVGSWIASTIGLRETMLLTAIPFGIVLLLSLTLTEPPFGKKVSVHHYFKTMFSGLRYLKNHRTLRILAVDMVSIAMIGYFIIWAYQQLLKNIGLDILYFGWVHFLVVAAEILVLYKIETVERLMGGSRAFLFFSSIITGISFIAAALLQDLTLLVIALLFAFGFSLTRQPVFESYFNKHIPSNKRATVLSSISMFKMLAIAIAAPVVGYFIDISITNTLITLGGLAIIFAFISDVKETMLKD